MLKNLVPISFLITFFIGLACAFGVGRSVSHTPPVPEIPQPLRADFQRRTAEPVEVVFNDFVSTEHGTAAEFRITNFSDVPYSYSTYDADTGQWDRSLLMEIEVGGETKPTRWCGTGLLTMKLAPGETIYSRVSWTFLGYNYKKGKSVRIGFRLGPENSRQSEIIWSDRLPITGELETSLLKEKRRIAESRETKL